MHKLHPLRAINVNGDAERAYAEATGFCFAMTSALLDRDCEKSRRRLRRERRRPA